MCDTSFFHTSSSIGLVWENFLSASVKSLRKSSSDLGRRANPMMAEPSDLNVRHQFFPHFLVNRLGVGKFSQRLGQVIAEIVIRLGPSRKSDDGRTFRSKCATPVFSTLPRQSAWCGKIFSAPRSSHCGNRHPTWAVAQIR